MLSKIKISQEELDKLYEIEEITGENAKDTQATAKPTQVDTTPEFLTEEETINEEKYLLDYQTPEETE